VNPLWEALNARARGLATHLIGRRALEELAAAADLESLGQRLAAMRVARASGSAAELDESVETTAAATFDRMRRWVGDSDALAVAFESEDRQCLRRLLRGVVQGAPPTTRTAGLKPTPDLPRSLIEALAAERSAAAVVRRIAARRHPLAGPLAAAVARGETDLLSLELALDHAFARRIHRCARLAPSPLRAYVSESIDLDNLWSALLAGRPSQEIDARQLFLEGGRRFDLAQFVQVLAMGELKERRRRLAEVFGPPIAALLRDQTVTLSQLEGRLLAARVAQNVRMARLDPLGPAPVLAYLLRLRAETHDLRRIIWGKACAMPAATIAEDLVTA